MRPRFAAIQETLARARVRTVYRLQNFSVGQKKVLFREVHCLRMVRGWSVGPGRCHSRHRVDQLTSRYLSSVQLSPSYAVEVIYSVRGHSWGRRTGYPMQPEMHDEKIMNIFLHISRLLFEIFRETYNFHY